MGIRDGVPKGQAGLSVRSQATPRRGCDGVEWKREREAAGRGGRS